VIFIIAEKDNAVDNEILMNNFDNNACTCKFSKHCLILIFTNNLSAERNRNTVDIQIHVMFRFRNMYHFHYDLHSADLEVCLGFGKELTPHYRSYCVIVRVRHQHQQTISVDFAPIVVTRSFSLEFRNQQMN
jgi:hypothetical protein